MCAQWIGVYVRFQQIWGCCELVTSRRARPTLRTPSGPYKYVDTAVGVWCHNPQVVTLPDGTYAMTHIGMGAGLSRPLAVRPVPLALAPCRGFFCCRWRIWHDWVRAVRSLLWTCRRTQHSELLYE